MNFNTLGPLLPLQARHHQRGADENLQAGRRIPADTAAVEAMRVGKPVGLGGLLNTDLEGIHTVHGVPQPNRLVLAHHRVQRERRRVR